MDMLSTHFSLAEGISSDTATKLGINNTAPPHIVATMIITASKLERVRALLNNLPTHINSFYRCPELNTAVGSKPSSQHLLGEAVDFVCPEFGTPLDICKKLIAYKDLVEFDQLILEHTWVHISFAISTGKPRGEVLSLLATGHYSSGLTDKKGKVL